MRERTGPSLRNAQEDLGCSFAIRRDIGIGFFLGRHEGLGQLGIAFRKMLGCEHHIQRDISQQWRGELVNQLINHAMVQHRADSIPFHEIDLVHLAREEMAEMLSCHASRMLDLEFHAPDTPCIVMGDPVTLREAVRNVLANALTYGAPALLHVEVARAGTDCELRIVDDGAGIPPADQERIRKPFAARSGDRSGASLGLSIVEEVMRAHGGVLRFGRNPDGHFVVTLCMPVHR